MKRRVLAVILGAVMATAGLAGCGGDTGSSSSSSEGEEMYTIGISQFAEHGSLDNCREGFIQGLEEEGLIEGENLEIKVNNADSDTGTAAQIADTFVADKVDLICAIATPSAQAAYNSARNTDIPVVYTAVTNPEEAQLADDEGMPVGAVTGTSDQLPVEAQLAFTLETAGVTNTSEVSLAAASLMDKVDCLTNLTDNTVVSALPTVLDQANEKNIPVFGSEIEQVKLGCLAAEGLDYVNLGIETGKMAAQILKGETKAEDMEYELLTDSSLYINQAVADNLGITIPDDMTERAEETFTEISQE